MRAIRQAKTEELVTADYAWNSGKSSSWGDDDPSVFKMKSSGKMMGEFQVTNGYGPLKAPQVMEVKLNGSKCAVSLRLCF